MAQTLNRRSLESTVCVHCGNLVKRVGPLGTPSRQTAPCDFAFLERILVSDCVCPICNAQYLGWHYDDPMCGQPLFNLSYRTSEDSDHPNLSDVPYEVEHDENPLELVTKFPKGDDGAQTIVIQIGMVKVVRLRPRKVASRDTIEAAKSYVRQLLHERWWLINDAAQIKSAEPQVREITRAGVTDQEELDFEVRLGADGTETIDCHVLINARRLASHGGPQVKMIFKDGSSEMWDYRQGHFEQLC